MGKYVIRGTKEPGSTYGIFSTFPDSFEWFFASRDELIEHMEEEARFRNPYWGPDNHMQVPDEVPAHAALEQRLERVDTHGSCSYMGSGGWGCGTLQMGEGMPPLPPGRDHWVLPRKNVEAYIRAMLADDEEVANALLVARTWDI
jgi:hypothetical protein